MEIIYEDNHLIAVNKKAGEIVQGDKTGDETLADAVKDYLKKKYKKPGNVFLGVTHRIDRPVSGVVVFARTSKALSRLNEMIKKHQVSKTYWAVVRRRPKVACGALTHYLVRNPEKNISVAYDNEVRNSQLATLYYRIAGEIGDLTVLEIDLRTGRHHQIRVQLAKIGCPIVGDIKYGDEWPNQDGSICLHSRKMEFVHPVTKVPLEITADLPQGPVWDEFRGRQQ